MRPADPVVETDAAVVLTSSGSSGTPKAAILTRDAVLAAAAASNDRLGGPASWAVALPTHYVAGLMTLARAQLAEQPTAAVRTDLADLAAAAASLPAPRRLSLVPTQLARAMRSASTAHALRAFDAVLVGGGPLDDDLVRRAHAADIALVRSYGLTETCGGCVYDGRPLGGVRVRLDAAGRVSIGGPTLFAGYRSRPDLTTEHLVDGWFTTSDRGSWEGEQLVILGRTDDVVVTGGLKVDLAEVERVAQQWARGHALVVVGLPDPEWGTRIVAVTDGPGETTGLRGFIAERLPAHAAPRDLVRLPSIPMLTSGKPDRATIRQLIAGQPPPRGDASMETP